MRQDTLRVSPVRSRRKAVSERLGAAGRATSGRLRAWFRSSGHTRTRMFGVSADVRHRMIITVPGDHEYQRLDCLADALAASGRNPPEAARALIPYANGLLISSARNPTSFRAEVLSVWGAAIDVLELVVAGCEDLGLEFEALYGRHPGRDAGRSP